MIFKVYNNIQEKTAALIAKKAEKTAHILAQQVKKDTEQYVPMLTGSLNIRTRVTGNTIIYPGPYARYLYYGNVMVDAATGKGPIRIVDKLGNEYIRFRNGAVLKPTSRPLQYTTDFHPKAGKKWFERSKAENLEKWIRVAKRTVNSGRE